MYELILSHNNIIEILTNLMIRCISPLEFWQADDQIDNYKECQDKPLWQTASKGNETLKDGNGQEFRTCRKITYPGTDFVSIRQRHPKYYSWGKCSKHNLNLVKIEAM